MEALTLVAVITGLCGLCDLVRECLSAHEFYRNNSYIRLILKLILPGIRETCGDGGEDGIVGG
jgi:hypothetical protein